MRARELKMLWFKVWLETRWRFIVALAILISFSLWSVLRFPDALKGGVRDMQHHNQPNAALRGVATYTQVEIFEKLVILWSILSVMLGTGGLLKEKLVGTAPFLLSLPVSRRTLVAARCAVSIFQAACLAIAAYVIVPLAFPLVDRSYSWGATLLHAAILVASGISFVVFGTLIAVIVEGTSWPAIIGATTVFLSLVAGELLTGFTAVAPFPVLSGESYFRYGLIPWTGIFVSLMIASLMLAFALWIVKWHDF